MTGARRRRIASTCSRSSVCSWSSVLIVSFVVAGDAREAGSRSRDASRPDRRRLADVPEQSYLWESPETNPTPNGTQTEAYRRSFERASAHRERGPSGNGPAAKRAAPTAAWRRPCGCAATPRAGRARSPPSASMTVRRELRGCRSTPGSRRSVRGRRRAKPQRPGCGRCFDGSLGCAMTSRSAAGGNGLPVIGSSGIVPRGPGGSGDGSRKGRNAPSWMTRL